MPRVDYIRVGSYTKKIIEFPSSQTQLWDKLRHEQFEEIFTMVDLQINNVVKYLKCDTYFDILLIHQVFFLMGAGPVVEIFENRVEVTNPGTPLVDIMRIIDNPPKSRNEKLASLMRRLNMCEELGRGWDRMVISCELQQLPAPRIQIYQESTKVSLFSHLDFTNIPVEDKLWSTYLHACIKFTEGEALTNTSLRERFGVADTSAGSISRLIKEAVNRKLIRPVDPNTAPRYMRYIPVWA